MLAPFDPFMPVVPPTSQPAAEADLSVIKDRVVAVLDVRREYAELGVRFTGHVSGFKHECHSVSRDDDDPSAFVNVKTGVYHSSGDKGESLHLFTFAVKYGNQGRWIDSLKHYAGRAGIEVGRVPTRSGGRVVEQVFEYLRADRQIHYRKIRYIQPNGKKNFSKSPPDGRGGWKFGPGCMDGVPPIPYNLPEIISRPGEVIWWSEGEQAAEAARSIGLLGTSADDGSDATDATLREVASYFAGRDVVFLPDNDLPGRKLAERACAILQRVARSIRRLDLPGLPIKGDIVEWIADGGNRHEIEQLAEECPEWKPRGEEPPQPGDDPPGLPDDFPSADDIELVMMDTIQPVAVRWLWPDVIPFGKLTQFGGEPKLGKSFLTTWLTAMVSTGGEIPGREGECFPEGSVIFLSAEDDKADTIRPRLDACGADCSRVGVLNTVRGKDGKFGPFTLAYVAHLERAIIQLGNVKLIVIDPITHYATAGFDDHKNTQVRQLLEPLRSLAEKYEIAVVFVHHFNKGNGTRALNRFSGSGAYGALARSNWVVIRDQDDPKRRLFLSAGCNLVEEPNGLAYRIDRELKRVVFEAEALTITADDALEASMARKDERDGGGGEKRVTKIAQCMDWLRDRIGSGSAKLVEIRDEIEERGFNVDTLYKAKKKLGIVETVSVVNGLKMWSLPPDPAVLPMTPS